MFGNMERNYRKFQAYLYRSHSNRHVSYEQYLMDPEYFDNMMNKGVDDDETVYLGGQRGVNVDHSRVYWDVGRVRDRSPSVETEERDPDHDELVDEVNERIRDGTGDQNAVEDEGEADEQDDPEEEEQEWVDPIPDVVRDRMWWIDVTAVTT